MNALIVLLGPTAVGKTEISLRLAAMLNSPVISADSRQIYKELNIGVAKPTAAQLAAIKHYFISTRSVTEYYSASMFEDEAIAQIAELHTERTTLLLCGGSMMYIDAVCQGIDEMPAVSPCIRQALWQQYESEGLAGILAELQRLDPQHYAEVDRRNYRRVLHAVELCRMTGKPYSSFRTRQSKVRPFRIFKIGLRRERAELYERINSRVDAMMAEGLLEEARRLLPMKNHNALNTVGYKELFAHFEGACSLEEAVEKIKSATRTYARKQMTWFKRDPSIEWFHPDNVEDILNRCDIFFNRK